MQNESNKIEIKVTSEFKRSLRTLAKRYRNIRSDVQPIINQLQTGEILVIKFQVFLTQYLKLELKIE